MFADGRDTVYSKQVSEPPAIKRIAPTTR